MHMTVSQIGFLSRNELEKLVLPSFAATNSIFNETEPSITNIFVAPLIPGPANYFSALYTGLNRAEKLTS